MPGDLVSEGGRAIIDNDVLILIDMAAFLLKLRYTTAFSLTGCALAGACLGWAHFSFDVHVVGAVVGGIGGAVFVFGGGLSESTNPKATR